MNISKISKVIITCIFIAVLGICFNINISQANSDLNLTNLDYEVSINSDGSMDVTEIWNISIRDTNTLYKTFEIDKSKYSSIEDVIVTDITEGSKKFTKTNKWKYHLDKGTYFSGINNDEKYEISWGVGLEDTRAQRKYKIQYRVEDAIAKYKDYAQLYWQFVGEDFEIDADKIQGRIILPTKANNTKEIRVWGHTEQLNGEIYVIDTNQIEFEITDFNSGRFVEIRTLFPTEMIKSSGRQKDGEILSTVLQEEKKWADDANLQRQKQKIIKILIVIAIDAIGIIIAIFQIRGIIKNSRKIKNTTKIEPTENMVYYRDIPRKNATPTEAIAVYSNTVELNSVQLGNTFSAILLDLKLKNVIDFEIEKNTKGKENTTIKILGEFPNNVQGSQDEREVLEFIKTAAKKSSASQVEVTMKQLEQYIKNGSTRVLQLKKDIQRYAEKSLKNSKIIDEERKKEYEETKGYKILQISFLIMITIFMFPVVVEVSKVTLVGFLLAIITMLINTIMLSVLNSKQSMYTQEGINEQLKWKALKKYMEEFSLLKEKEVPEIVLWEKFLVFATAFGIADKVLKQLKIVYPDFEQQIDINANSGIYLMMHTNLSSTFSNSISSSMSSTYSSSTGGGGGFSGGGGGGRWPEEVAVVDNHLFVQNNK